MGGEIATVPENRSETYCRIRVVPFWYWGLALTKRQLISCWRYRLHRWCGGVSHHGSERTAASGGPY